MSVYIKPHIVRFLLATLLLVWLVPSKVLFAQDESTEAETVEKDRSRMSLTTTQFPGDTIELKGLLRAKIDNQWTKISGEKIEFFAVGEEEDKSLGEFTTNSMGLATVLTSTKAMPVDENGYLTFEARFDGSETLKKSDGDANILKAVMVLTPVAQGDSAYTLQVKVEAPSADSIIPVSEADVVISIKRMVGQLAVGEATTDENGEAEIEFPTGLAGDDVGNLYITAFIEDFEEYGNIAAKSTKAWGRPVSSKFVELPRTLWSPHPPFWMVATFFILMAAVWGHYAVVVYKLNQLKKAGNSN